MMGDISEESYKKLRDEWLEKLQNDEMHLVELEKTVSTSLSDLDKALLIMSKVPELYGRLKSDGQAALLNILVKRLDVDLQGNVINQELHAPFGYLKEIIDDFKYTVSKNRDLPWEGDGSELIIENRPLDKYLSQLRFEGRKKLGELSL